MPTELLSAGQFAKLARTTKRTILWYDEKGLITPHTIHSNGYRYYQPYQIIDFQVILLLRKLGFSIEEIRTYLSKNHSLQNLFQLKQNVIKKEITILQKSLLTITQYYNSLNNHQTLVAPQKKQVKSFSIFYIEKEGPYAQIKNYCLELKSYFQKISADAIYLTVFFGGYQPKNAKMHIGVIARKDMKVRKDAIHMVKKETIPQLTALVYRHEGSGTLVSLLWQEMEKYLHKNHLKQNTHLPFVDFELYKKTSLNHPMDEDDMIFELYLPIA